MCKQSSQSKRVLGSAYFSLGSILLELNDKEGAKHHFELAIRILKEELAWLLKKEGQEESTDIMLPSVFDNI